MKKIAIFIVKGEVQKVGYRDFVQSIGRKLGLVGTVENLEDGTVKIIAEGEENILLKYRQLVEAKGDTLIRVEEIQDTYKEPTGEFKNLSIKRGKSDEETAERLDTAVVCLKGLIQTVKKMDENLGEKVDCVGRKVGQVGEKVDSMHEDMNKRFDSLDEKYHVISEVLLTMNKNLLANQEQFTTLNKNLANTQSQLTKVVDKLTLIVDRFIENEMTSS